MVRRHTFTILFLVLAGTNMLQGQIFGEIGKVFPTLVKRLAINELGDVTHDLASQAADIPLGISTGVQKFLGNIGQGWREDLLPRINTLKKWRSSFRNPSISSGQANAASSATAESTLVEA